MDEGTFGYTSSNNIFCLDGLLIAVLHQYYHPF